MSQATRSIRRRERLKRRLRRIVVALGTVLVALTTLFYFFPLQSGWLKQRVELELSNALSRPVAIGEIFVYVFQSQVVIHDITLFSSSSSPSASPPFHIKKAVLHMAILSLPWRGLDSISLVEVHEPDNLAAVFDDSHSFHAAGVPGEMLEDILQNRSASSGAKMPALLPINVTMYRALLTLDVAPSPISSFSVRLAEGTLRGNRLGDLSTFINGYVVYGNTLAPYQADLSYRASNESVDGRIILAGDVNLETAGIPGIGGAPIQVSDLSIGLRRDGAAGSRLFDIEVSASECRLPWPGRPSPLDDKDIRARARFIPPAERGGPFVIDPFEWRSSFGELDGRLAFQPDAATTYTIHLSHARLGPAALRESLAFASQQSGLKFDDRLTSVSFSLAAAGSLPDGIGKMSGRWALSHLEMAHPSLPAPITLNHIDGTFDNHGLRVNTLSIEAFDTVIDGQGHLDAPDFQPRVLRMEWNTMTGLEQAGAILATLAPNAPAANLGGKIQTNGWVKIQFPAGAPSIESADFDIEILPANAVYEFPSRGLRGAIIGGELHLRPSLMEFRNLRIRQFDSLFQVRGTITGEQYFWRAPQASLGIEGTLPLNDFITQVLPRREGQAPLVTAFGQMDLKAQLSGLLNTEGQLYLRTEGDIRQATINFPSFQNLAGISRLDGKWNFSGDVVQVQSLNGQWGPIPFSVHGRIAPRLISLNATSSLRLEDFARQIPKLEKDYVLYGPVTANGTIACAVPDDIFTTGSLDTAAPPTYLLAASLPQETRQQTERIVEDIRRAIRYFLTIANAEARRSLPILQSREIDLRGSLIVRDGTFGHVSMPALISHINADMEWANNRLSWTGATGMAGRSAIVSGPCFIDLAGATPAMNFTGTMQDFDLNQWIADWPSGDYPTTATLHSDRRTTRTLFTIDLDAMAKRAQIYKYQIGGFSGTMHYEKWRNVPSWLEFDAASSDAFTGSGSAKGKVTFARREKPYFDFTVTANRVSLEQYFKQVSPRHAGIRGFVTGECAVWGRPKDSKNLRGEGQFIIEDSEFLRFPIFDALADLTSVDGFRQMSFSRIEGNFELRDGRVNLTRVVCDNPLLKIQAVGWVDYDTNVNIDITLSYFRAIGSVVPILSGVMEQMDALIGMTVAVKVTGSLDEPVVKLEVL